MDAWMIQNAVYRKVFADRVVLYYSRHKMTVGVACPYFRRTQCGLTRTVMQTQIDAFGGSRFPGSELCRKGILSVQISLPNLSTPQSVEKH